ncbi:DUF2877 domain-containing protein [Photobacterium lutimaris]|uniref:DUF2877 domain-containing protein n=1 Tax=Photobacterium lutimaris TaxID=388278 RepID=UPI001414DCE8|nr:DUF2877 domain-containing protein [Photobacterium lutimaris]
MGDTVFMRGEIIRLKPPSRLAINTVVATNWQQAPPLPFINKKRVWHNILIAERIFAEYISEKEKQPFISISEYIQYLGLNTPRCIYSLPEQLVENIGRGKGLTPSGDDFLLGVLAVLSYVREAHPDAATTYQRFQIQVPRDISKTTDISAHYLTLALSQHFSKPVQWLVYYLFTATDRLTIETAITTNLLIGSSSGADTIAGIVYCINKLLLS